MSSPASKLVRRLPAASPAVAGHHPLGIALAVAACFAGGAVHAQGVGAQAIAGAAVVTQQGKVQTVTTTNVAGGNHSAINWQSFSIPSGYTTNFVQPTAQSTSINRVLGNNPSAIFGTLSSNGKIVLINPSGIAVGKGAVVDTNGFTASALGMNPADAIAGKLRFGDGASVGTVSVDGRIYARGGDVVLLAPNVSVGEHALIQTPDGATILAAGQKAQITGRGLEGIALEVTAPANEAINFGRIQGDAVGVFAGTLKHSGAIVATGVSAQGGKVVLKASDVAIVTGSIAATTAAGKGGSVDVLGKKVGLMDGASIDASGPNGGGSVRVGGDYKGGNASVQNAEVTYVASGASIKANATQSGDGGRVIVWSDDTTRAYGSIEAKGGPNGGNGGFVETSGKRYLDVNGVRVDTSAPRGRTGMWLLDPADLRVIHAPPPPAPPPGDQNIVGGGNFAPAPGASTATITDATINTALGTTNVTITTSNSGGEGAGNITFDASSAAGGDITIVAAGGRSLSLNADNNIYFDGGLTTFQRSGGTGRFAVSLNAAGKLVQTNGPFSPPAPSGSPAPAPVTPGVRLRDGVDVVLNTGTTWDNLGLLQGEGSDGNSVSGGSGFSNSSGTVSVDSGSTLSFTRFSQSGGMVEGGGSVTVTESFSKTAGSFDIGGVATLTQADTGEGSTDLVIANGLSAAGGISITAQGNLNVQIAGTLKTNGNLITIGTSGGSVTGYGGGFATLDASASVSSGASGGSVSITTGTGGVHVGDIFTRGASLGSSSGSVYIATNSSGAAADIITGNIYTDGPLFGPVEYGGAVTITTNVGSIETGSINTAPSFASSGGSINLSTQVGSISVGTITSYAGGDVSLSTGRGNITFRGDVMTGGANLRATVYQQGDVDFSGASIDTDGGSVTLAAYNDGGEGLGGNIVGLDTPIIDTSNSSGRGGDVTLTAQGSGTRGFVTAGTIITNGGDTGATTQLTSLVSSTDAGSVNITADQDVTVGAITARGNNSSSGYSGGNVSIYSDGGSITFTSIDTGGGNASDGNGGRAGNISLDAYMGISSAGALMANGGTGTNIGGAGGDIELYSSGQVTVGTIEANGGAGTGTSLGAGGRGGSVYVDAYGFSASSIVARGGAAASGYGADGGEGGHVSIYTGPGGISIAGPGGGMPAIDVGGGAGGSATGANGSGGGYGGDAGSVSLSAYGGNIYVGGISAVGGAGGQYTGSDVTVGSGSGGYGGSVSISTEAGGGITLFASSGEGPAIPAVNTSGGAGGSSTGGVAGSGGDAGNIAISTDYGTMSLGALMAKGGTGGASVVGGEGSTGGRGGEGYHVSIYSGSGDLDLGPVSIDTSGGAGGTGSTQGIGGYGGNINITAAEGSLSLSGTLDTRPGAGTGTPPSGSIYLRGGYNLDFSGEVALLVNEPTAGSQYYQPYVSLSAGSGGITQSVGTINQYVADPVNIAFDTAGSVTLNNFSNKIGFVSGGADGGVSIYGIQGVGADGVTAVSTIDLRSSASMEVNGDVTSWTGNVLLTAPNAISLNANVSAGEGNVSMVMDNLYIGMTSSEGTPVVTASSAGAVELNTYTSSRPIAIGGSVGSPGSELVLQDLSPFYGGTLRIGRAVDSTDNQGGITLTGPGLVQPSTSALSLFTGGLISQTGSPGDGEGRIKVDNLQASGGEGVFLYDNQVGTLSGTAGGDGFVFRNSGALRIGTVDGVAGISSSPSTGSPPAETLSISVFADGGDLTVAANVASNNGSTNLSATGEIVFDAASSGEGVTLSGTGGAFLAPGYSGSGQPSLGSGTVRFTSGTTSFAQHVRTSGEVAVNSDATLDVQAGKSFTFFGGSTSGTVHLNSGSWIDATGFDAEGAPLSGEGARTFTINDDGVLSGNGTVYARELTNNGTVSPGNSPGTLYLFGDYVQGSNGVLAIDVFGSSPGTGYDQFYIYGDRYLDGTLRVTTNASSPARNGTYDITPGEGMQFGNFRTVSAPGYAARYEPLASPAPAPSGSPAPAPAGASFLILGNGNSDAQDQANQQVVRDQENVVDKFLTLYTRDEADRRKANDDVVLQCRR